MKTFTYNNVNSEGFNAFMVNPPSFNTAEPDIEEIEVPGRSGNIIVSNGRYKNVQVRYPVIITNGFQENYELMRQELPTDGNYYRLEDDFDTDHFRMAALQDSIEPDTTTPEGSTEFEVVFNCKPQRFRTDGETRRSFTAKSQKSENAAVIPYADLPEDLKTWATFNETDEIIKVTHTTAKTYTRATLKMSNAAFGVKLAYKSGSAIGVFHAGETTLTSASGVTYEFYFVNAAGVTLKWGTDTIYTDGMDNNSCYTVTNPTKNAAKPLIELTIDSGSGTTYDENIYRLNESFIRLKWAGSITINNTSVMVNTLIIDAESLNAYSPANGNTTGKMLNMNPYVYITGNLEAKPGANKVATSSRLKGNSTKFRWWDL